MSTFSPDLTRHIFAPFRWNSMWNEQWQYGPMKSTCDLQSHFHIRPLFKFQISVFANVFDTSSRMSQKHHNQILHLNLFRYYLNQPIILLCVLLYKLETKKSSLIINSLYTTCVFIQPQNPVALMVS